MDLREDDFKRTAHAPAKLNLFLDVLGRRGDGFHDLETMMVPIRLADQVSFTPTPKEAHGHAGRILFDVRTCWPVRSPPQPPEIPAGSDNLIVNALELFRRRSGCSRGAHVQLVKRIPWGAGMGGGSSDAAAALKLANRGWHIDWSDERLSALAAEVGSDVPFFLSHSPAICRGRGERVERLPLLPTLYFVVVKPPAALRTNDVYRSHDSMAGSKPITARGSLDRLKTSLSHGDWCNLGRWMQNRLQAAASLLSPCVDELRRTFAELDFVGHQLTGSGSAYFGVCRHAQHARRLATILRTRQLGLVYATRSCQ
ncbi:MAG TPA: 4-(cytidine 5'-diphospho)-2-C-methyl-D-erythritol kinase [Lacipirellulaceae bacterium]|nr:4-(cytidine 5'-diphospho)-2-C-methyl-D-erythritol kinase [Lacipirellulaceae bacterium]